MTYSYPTLQTRQCLVLSLTFLVLNASFSTTTIAISILKNSKLVLQLIHRDAIPHLFSNHRDHAFSASLIRDEIRGPLIPTEEGSVFLVNISIGDPQIPQLLVIDTGSPLTWVQTPKCRGCTPALRPIYVPQTSSTYKPLSCDYDAQCRKYIDHSNCGHESQCTYNTQYLDKSSSKGIVASEKFTFATSTGGESVISDLVFGYGLQSSGNADELSGILGLEVLNNNSLVSRVGNKFSYCIGNVTDPYYAYNRLTLGEGAVFEGYTTPMRIWNGHYMVSLKGITVGTKQLDINQAEFDYKVVIDSGTTLTYLQRSAYEMLAREVRGILDGVVSRVANNGDDDRLCYYGDLGRDLNDFPIVTLNFGEGAEIYMGVESLFRRGRGVFCMAVEVATSEVNIVGLYAQQYHNFGFDLNGMRVSFVSIECELLED